MHLKTLLDSSSLSGFQANDEPRGADYLCSFHSGHQFLCISSERQFHLHKSCASHQSEFALQLFRLEGQ